MSTRRPVRSARRSAFIRGNAGLEKVAQEAEHLKQKEEQRKAQRNQPFRFWVPVGEEREIIILDDRPDFFMYEHGLRDEAGRWGRLFTGCVKEFDTCPVCVSEGQESYYAMFLTALDLTPFSTRTGEQVEFSRKLICAKSRDQKKFIRFFRKEGSLRGARFIMHRDQKKTSSIGDDFEFIEFVEEDELAEYVREWTDKEGKVHVEDCSEPFVYEDLFEEPTVESLERIVGGGAVNPYSAVPGSRRAEQELDRPSRRVRGRARQAEEEVGDDGWEDSEDDSEYGEEEAPARTSTRRRSPATTSQSSRARTRRRAEPEAEDDEYEDVPDLDPVDDQADDQVDDQEESEEEHEEEHEEETPRRAGRRTAPRTAPRTTSRTTSRTAPRTASRRSPSRSTGRSTGRPTSRRLSTEDVDVVDRPFGDIDGDDVPW